jgi:hypothetical protein
MGNKDEKVFEQNPQKRIWRDRDRVWSDLSSYRCCSDRLNGFVGQQYLNQLQQDRN